jgi:hypothetical protein
VTAFVFLAAEKLMAGVGIISFSCEANFSILLSLAGLAIPGCIMTLSIGARQNRVTEM